MFEDKQLVVRWSMGDTHALRQIYEKYKDRMVTLAAALLQDKNAAEDAVHEVFVRLIKKRDRLRITENLMHYLFACTANEARNINRQKQPVSMKDECLELPAQQDQTLRPQQYLFLKEQTEKLTEVLSTLPYEQHEVILLRHYGDLKFRDIARIQQVSINTAQGRYRYGMEQLRSLLDGETL